MRPFLSQFLIEFHLTSLCHQSGELLPGGGGLPRPPLSWSLSSSRAWRPFLGQHCDLEMTFLLGPPASLLRLCLPTPGCRRQRPGPGLSRAYPQLALPTPHPTPCLGFLGHGCVPSCHAGSGCGWCPLPTCLGSQPPGLTANQILNALILLDNWEVGLMVPTGKPSIVLVEGVGDLLQE